jgi:hypothetical protein
MPPRLVSILTALQLFVVFLGVSVTSGFLKLFRAQWPYAELPSHLQFMRDYGFWFGLLPLAWAVAAVVSIRSPDRTPNTGLLSTVMGFFLLALLLFVFTASGVLAFAAATDTGVGVMR